MKKLGFLFFFLAGCAMSRTTTITSESVAGPGAGAPEVQVAQAGPPEPQPGESRRAFLERQIQEVEGQIKKLEPSVIEAQNSIDTATYARGKHLKEQLHDLERRRASYELQLMSLETQ